MPRAKKHFKTGFLFGIISGGLISLFKQLAENYVKTGNRINWFEVMGWGFIGGLVAGFFSLLPDILEPAYTPNHRGFFHSYTVLGLLAVALYKIDQKTDINIARKSLTFCAIIGYGSHLVLDSETPVGLDLI